MSPSIVGFVTRADAGLRPAESYSSDIQPEWGGVALHYGGPPSEIEDHLDCLRTWLGWQRYHMDTHGWVDIAYTMGVCDHGYVFAGRGARRRTAANGTNDGNDRFYAVVWIGGEGETPTPLALDAIAWAVRELRRSGGAGREVRSHGSFKETKCPGEHVAHYASELNGLDLEAVVAPPQPPSPPAKGTTPAYPGVTREPTRDSPITRAYQARLKQRGWTITVDGDHGPGTTKVLRQFQQEKGLGADGVGGRATWRALWTAAVT